MEEDVRRTRPRGTMSAAASEEFSCTADAESGARRGTRDATYATRRGAANCIQELSNDWPPLTWLRPHL